MTPTPEPSAPSDIVAILRASSDEFCDGPYATSGELSDHSGLLTWAADEIERLRLYRDILAGIMDDDADVYVALDDDAVCIDGWLDLTPAEVQALRALEAPR